MIHLQTQSATLALRQSHAEERMLEMDLVHAIRWKFHKEGLSLREIAVQLGCSRNTVKKYISQAEPAYRRTKKHSAPIRDKAERRIAALIEKWENDTTDKAFGEWVQVFGCEKLTTALLDRLVHHSHILTTKGESYRTRRAKKKPTKG